jgi:pSer/pThr/pTyr-binding forkhead associated (FHA) protein
MNKKANKQLTPIGSVIVSGSTGFRAFISPDRDLGPGTVGFQVYEKLESIFHDPNVDKELYDEIVRVFDYLELGPRQEVLVLAEEDGRIAHVYILPNPKEKPIKLVDMRVENSVLPSVADRSDKSESTQDIHVQEYASIEVEALLDGILVGDEGTIGRKSESKYLATVGLVSRKHLEVQRVGIDEFVLRDLQSTNGTDIEENNRWVPLKRAVRIRSGTRIRLGGSTSAVIAAIPGAINPLLPIQGALARLLGAMGPNGESVIGGDNRGLGLDYIEGMPPELLRIARKKKTEEYLLEPLSSQIPISFLVWGGECWQSLDREVSLTAGGVVKIGDRDAFVRMPIPSSLHEVIVGLSPYTELEIGRSSKGIDLSVFHAMSRSHAILFKLPDKSIVVNDLGSTNGTRIRENQDEWIEVKQPMRVRSGGEILFGSESQGLVMVVP